MQGLADEFIPFELFHILGCYDCKPPTHFIGSLVIDPYQVVLHVISGREIMHGFVDIYKKKKSLEKIWCAYVFSPFYDEYNSHPQTYQNMAIHLK